MLIDAARLSPVETVRDISRDEFVRRYLLASSPVLIKGAVSHWPCVRRWSSAYLAERAGDNRVAVRHLDPNVQVRFEEKTLRRFLDQVEDDDPDRGYVSELPLKDVLPQLLGEIGPRPFTDTPPGELGIALGSDTYTPGHFHPWNEAISTQIFGRRRFVLFHPDQTRYLYPAAWWGDKFNFSRVHFLSDDTERFGQVRDACGYEAILEPGDSLYIPIHYWHVVKSLDGLSLLLIDLFPSPARRYRHTYPGVVSEARGLFWKHVKQPIRQARDAALRAFGRKPREVG